MPTPSTTIEWATLSVAEYTLSPSGDAVLVLNKVEPSVATKQNGISTRQPIIRPYINYILNSHANWIEHLRVGEVGDLKTAPIGTTITDMADRYGGTWQQESTDTIGGVSVQVFTRLT